MVDEPARLRDLAVQLYSLRLLDDLDAGLEGLARLGFRRVETVGAQLREARGFYRRLEAHGLTAATSHVDLADLRERPDAVAQWAAVLGATLLVVPALPRPERAGADWRRVADELARLADAMGAHGLALAYHNHDFELVLPATGGPDAPLPLDILLDDTEGSPLTFEADLAWIARAGADPAAWLSRFGDRLAAVHVKDLASPGESAEEDGWADVGQGILPWRELCRQALDQGVDHLVLEHDKPSDALRFARVSRQALAEMLA